MQIYMDLNWYACFISPTRARSNPAGFELRISVKLFKLKSSFCILQCILVNYTVIKLILKWNETKANSQEWTVRPLGREATAEAKKKKNDEKSNGKKRNIGRRK